MDVSAPLQDTDAEAVFLFSQSGKCQSGFNGPERLSWSDVQAWANLTGAALTTTDADLIVNMSASFCAGYHQDDAPHEPLACRMALATAEMAAAF